MTPNPLQESAVEQAIDAPAEEGPNDRLHLYKAILDATPDLIYAFALDHTFTYANAALLKMWGKTEEESLGKTCLELGYEPWHAAMHDREIDLVISTGMPIKGEVPFPHETLGRRIYEYIFSPVFGENGEVVAISGATRDVTDRRRGEEYTEFLNELTQELALITDEEEIIHIAVSRLGRFLDVHRCHFLEWTEGDDVVIIGKNWVRDSAVPLPAQLDLGPLGGRERMIPNIKTGMAVFDVLSDPGTRPYAPGFQALQVRAYAARLLRREENRVIQLAVTENQPRYWRDHELALIEGVAARVWPLVERTRLAIATSESDKRLRQVSDHVPALISYIDREGFYRFHNARYEEWFGLTQILGKHMREILGAQVYEERIPYVDQVLAGVAQRFEGPTLHRDLGMRITEISYLPDFAADGTVSGFYVTVLDITDRKNASDALALKSERLRLLWETTGIILQSEDSETMLQLLFSKIGGHIGADVYIHFIADPEIKRLELHSYAGISATQAEGIASLDFDEAICGRVASRRKAIVVSDVQISLDRSTEIIRGLGMGAYASLPLVSGDHLLGTLSFGSRTRDHFAPDELEFIETISHYITSGMLRLRLLQDLLETDRRKDEFLATLAHELRNPLAPIRTGVAVLKHHLERDSGNAEVVHIVERQTAQMVRLIDDLLDVSRITRGKMELKAADINLLDALHSAIETARPFIDEAGHRLILLLRETSLPAHGDLNRLSQIFSNLLSNAARYTPRGGSIELSAEKRGDEAVIHIRDDGEGIEPHMHERIFEMFSQVERPGDQVAAGLGIGLTLVKSLVELHGGTVKVFSQGLGKGSDFQVVLPLSASAESTVSASEPATTPSIARKILIADDGVSTADMMALFFRLEGHDAHAAYHGAEAVEKSIEWQPDIVFLDIGMPVMDGFEAAGRIRAALGETVTLVALTGWGQESDRAKTKAAGFDHHLVKPVDPKTLREFLAGQF